jgi:2,5-dioxopentanoate dehydrogenase
MGFDNNPSIHLSMNPSIHSSLNPPNLEGLSIIGYGRANRSGGASPAINPATGGSLEPAWFAATLQDVDTAAQLAAKAFDIYRGWAPKQRATLLRRIADLFEANAPAIIERANLETALAIPRLQGESARTCGQLRLFASLLEAGWWQDARIDHADPGRKPVPKPDVRSMLAPLGSVVVFSSSNFPLAFSVAGGDTASALAAGCPVIVKPHQGHPGTSELVGLVIIQAARECGAPEGIFSMLYGPGREIGIALVRHPLVKAVGFTGSRSGGRALMDAAAARPEPIPVYAEMGSINPVFFLPRALEAAPETLAAGLHASVTLGVGQFCTNPGLVFVETGPAPERFIQKLENLMSGTPAGTMLTAGICAEYHAGLEKFARVPGVRRTGATLDRPVVGGASADQSHSSHHSQSSHQPGLGGASARAALFVTDADTFLKDHSLMDEVFGPSTLVVCCRSHVEMVTAAVRLEGQLTATVHATPEDLQTSGDLMAILETKAGRLLCNGFPTGVEVGHAMMHGGPYPATADGRSTSVGTRALTRFLRPICYQNFPESALPEALRDSNPENLWRLVDGNLGQH